MGRGGISRMDEKMEVGNGNDEMLAPSAQPPPLSSATAVVTAVQAADRGRAEAAETANTIETAETENGIPKFPVLNRKGRQEKQRMCKGKTEEKCRDSGPTCIGEVR